MLLHVFEGGEDLLGSSQPSRAHVVKRCARDAEAVTNFPEADFGGSTQGIRPAFEGRRRVWANPFNRSIPWSPGPLFGRRRAVFAWGVSRFL